MDGNTVAVRLLKGWAGNPIGTIYPEMGEQMGRLLVESGRAEYYSDKPKPKRKKKAKDENVGDSSGNSDSTGDGSGSEATTNDTGEPDCP